jgi:hypothetical protein
MDISHAFVDLTFIMLVPFGLPALGMITWHRRQMTRLRLQRDVAANEARPQNDGEQIAVLEARLRVLERIVTDRGSTLAHEIEALRLNDAGIHLQR